MYAIRSYYVPQVVGQPMAAENDAKQVTDDDAETDADRDHQPERRDQLHLGRRCLDHDDEIEDVV